MYFLFAKWICSVEVVLEVRYEICQIPEEILENLTTEELLHMVEMYPNFTATYRYDNQAEGFSNLVKNFNGLQELLLRDDCKTVVLQEYINWEIPIETAFDYDKYISEGTVVDDMNAIMQDECALKLIRQDAREQYIVRILELILTEDSIQKEMTKNDIASLSSALVEKAEMKASSACFEYDGTSCAYSGQVNQETASVALGVELLTRGGEVIPYTVVSNPSTQSMSESIAWITAYDYCTVVDVANTAYNCYAYAWLSLDEENEDYRKSVRVNSDVCFTEDSTYKKTKATIRVGDVVRMTGHAGVVVQVAYTYQPNTSKPPITEPLIISKWGNGPLVQHPLSIGGYTGFDGYFYK